MTRELGSVCRAVLDEADPRAKVMRARAAARDWRLGRIAHRFDVAMPDRPARGTRPPLLPPSRMPGRGKAGSVASRIALLHAIAHMEFMAIDLAFDLAGRFGPDFPRGFVDDWLGVGADEAIHFALLDRRLRTLGAAYGDLPAHDGLWEAAVATAGDPLARLAVVPMAMEARGLDVTPQTAARFAAAGDLPSARILQRILTDEIRHVAAGVRWFGWVCGARGVAPVATWQAVVGGRFRGLVKPPFNGSARAAAGLTLDYYAAVAADAPSGQT